MTGPEASNSTLHRSAIGMQYFDKCLQHIKTNAHLPKIDTQALTLYIIHFAVHLRGGIQKLLRQPKGRSERGIGYSFQLAITAPRKILIGYGTATAQS